MMVWFLIPYSSRIFRSASRATSKKPRCLLLFPLSPAHARTSTHIHTYILLYLSIPLSLSLLEI